MTRQRNNRVFCWLCVSIAVGIIIGFVNFIIALLVVIISVSIIIYIHQTQDDDVSKGPPLSSVASHDSETHFTLFEEVPNEEFTPTPKLDETELDAQTAFSLFKTRPERQGSDTSEELQKRIGELEKRVQSLKEQLARDQIPSGDIPITQTEEIIEEEVQDQEFLEKAIQQLLETLEEKLAKRAISEQLYNRLRDKYIVRIQKAKNRREVPLKRGPKDSSKGDI